MAVHQARQAVLAQRLQRLAPLGQRFRQELALPFPDGGAILKLAECAVGTETDIQERR